MPLHDKRTRLRATVAEAACCGLLLVLCGQARAEDAKTLHEEAVRLYNAGDFEQSIKVLERARGLTEEPKLLGRIELYIGVNHAVLERAEQAKKSFETALGFDPTLRLDSAKFKQQLVALFDEVLASLKGELEVTADRPGATVLLDWKEMGQAPFRGQVAIGAHKVAVRTSDGRFGFKGEVVVHVDKLARVAARLEPLKQAEEEQRAQHERELQLRREAEQQQELDDTTRVRRRKTILGYTALGVGLALTLSAVVTFGVAYSQGSDALDDYDKATAEPDVAGTRTDEIAGLRDDVDSANSKLTASYVLFGLGTAALGYSLYELLTRPPESREASQEHRLGIMPGPDGALLSYGCRF
jgi:tetratricopeptide (TPR) repeat protein